MSVNSQALRGQWNKVKGQVKEKWGQLSDDDLQFQSGNIDQLVGRIQQKTGEGRDAVESFLNDLTSKGGSMISQAAETVGEYAGHATDRLRDNYAQLADHARDRFEDSREVVRRNPAESMAVAIGVGFVAGLFVGLSLRSR